MERYCPTTRLYAGFFIKVIYYCHMTPLVYLNAMSQIAANVLTSYMKMDLTNDNRYV